MARVLTKVGVCGAGAMGSGIAQIAAQHGADVIVFDVNPAALQASEAGIGKSLTALEGKGKLSADQAQDIRARLRWSDDLALLADRELVIEAIIEDARIKSELFGRLEAVLPADTVIASNTSSLPIGRLASTLEHPARFLGMHFFNPATMMKLVEVIPGPATDAGCAAGVTTTAEHWGKVAIRVADVPGFIVNRVARPFYGEAFAALQEDAAQPEEIDALFRAVGFRMGPLELTDLIGQDVNFAVARSVFESYFGQTRFVPQLKQAALVDAGWLGRKSGRGVYDYSASAPAKAEAGVPEATEDAHHAIAEGLANAVSGELAEAGGILFGITRGRTARSEAELANRSVALFDYFHADGDGAVGFTASDERAANLVRGAIGALGRAAIRLSDRPGLIVARTLAQIANAAADAVFERVADEAGVDAALRYGANYPFGPFAFVDRLGRSSLQALLRNIAEATGQPMYSPSQYLRVTA